MNTPNPHTAPNPKNSTGIESTAQTQRQGENTEWEGFSSESANLQLQDIAQIQTGPFGSQLHASDYVANGTPCIMPTNIGNRLEVHTSGIAQVSENDILRLKRYLVTEGDIVYSRRGDIEKCAYINKSQNNWLCGTGCLRVRPDKEKVNPKYLAYQLSSNDIKQWLVSRAVGATMPNLNTSILGEIPLLLPPLWEQEAIAEVLSSLDDKIDLLHRQNTTLEALAQTLFRQWFIEEAKEEWEEVELGELCIEINSGGTPSTKIESYYGGNIPWYSTTELKDGFLIDSKKNITELGLNNSSAKLFPPNTIVIAIYAAPTVGRLGILTKQSTFNQAACGLVANEDIISFEYLYILLFLLRVDLNDMASGTAQQNLNVSTIRKIKTQKPDFRTMNKFKLAVRPLFDKIRTNVMSIQQLTTLRDTLLPKLVSGEVRVGG